MEKKELKYPLIKRITIEGDIPNLNKVFGSQDFSKEDELDNEVCRIVSSWVGRGGDLDDFEGMSNEEICEKMIPNGFSLDPFTFEITKD